MNLGFGFPAVVAISPSKSKFGILKGSFNQERLSDFLSDLMSGRVSLEDLKSKPAIKQADKWDGNDATPYQEVIKIKSLSIIGIIRRGPLRRGDSEEHVALI